MRCTGCNLPTGADWKSLCHACYIAKKKTETEVNEFLLKYFQLENDRLKALLAQQAAPTLDAARIKQLLMLCHPDKHDNSSLSTEITKWLLSQRKTKGV